MSSNRMAKDSFGIVKFFSSGFVFRLKSATGDFVLSTENGHIQYTFHSFEIDFRSTGLAEMGNKEYVCFLMTHLNISCYIKVHPSSFRLVFLLNWQHMLSS